MISGFVVLFFLFLSSLDGKKAKTSTTKQVDGFILVHLPITVDAIKR